MLRKASYCSNTQEDNLDIHYEIIQGCTWETSRAVWEEKSKDTFRVMKRKMRICKKIHRGWVKKKKKNWVLLTDSTRTEQSGFGGWEGGQAAPQWQLPHGFLDSGWEMAVVLGVTRNVFHLMPSLSVGSVRAKPEEVVSFGEPLVTVLSSGGAGRPEGCHQGPRALSPVWLERSLLDS